MRPYRHAFSALRINGQAVCEWSQCPRAPAVDAHPANVPGALWDKMEAKLHLYVGGTVKAKLDHPLSA
jgi:hypothetical protein